MSTQDTAALVESVNKMTETVAGKIGEIDKKVEDANQLFRNLVTSDLWKEVVRSQKTVIHVDTVDGNDENDGSNSTKAVKTSARVAAL